MTDVEFAKRYAVIVKLMHGSESYKVLKIYSEKLIKHVEDFPEHYERFSVDRWKYCGAK